MQASKNEKVTLCKTAVVAGTSDITDATAIDMANFEGCKFYFVFGTLTASQVTLVKASQAATSSPATDASADIAGSKYTLLDADSDKVVVLDVYKPKYRYLRPWVDRGTQNAVLSAIIAVQYEPKKAPTTDDSATVPSRIALVSPEIGTA